jgi:hypothetical protein
MRQMTRGKALTNRVLRHYCKSCKVVGSSLPGLGGRRMIARCNLVKNSVSKIPLKWRIWTLLYWIDDVRSSRVKSLILGARESGSWKINLQNLITMFKNARKKAVHWMKVEFELGISVLTRMNFFRVTDEQDTETKYDYLLPSFLV